MAFQNVVMPQIKLIHNISKQVTDPVTVTGNGNRELRRKQNRYERFTWRIPANAILKADQNTLYYFFRNMNMSLDSFLYQDPDFPEFIDTPLLNHKSGNDWYFELPGGHPIFNPQMGSLTFKVNGVPKAATFAIDTAGRPVVTVADSSSGTVTLSGPCYLTARLGSTLQWSIAAMDKSPVGTANTPTPTIVLLGELTIMEVFER